VGIRSAVLPVAGLAYCNRIPILQSVRHARARPALAWSEPIFPPNGRSAGRDAVARLLHSRRSYGRLLNPMATAMVMGTGDC
jgi:hypothetical protein